MNQEFNTGLVPQVENLHSSNFSQLPTINLDSSSYSHSNYNQNFSSQNHKRLSSGSNSSYASTTLSSCSTSSNQLQLPHSFAVPNQYNAKFYRQQSDSCNTWTSETVSRPCTFKTNKPTTHNLCICFPIIQYLLRNSTFVWV